MSYAKVLGAVLVGGSTLFLAAQTHKQIDWKPCQAVTDKFRVEVDKFNAEHKDGFRIDLSCSYSGDPEKRLLPKQYVVLTPSEVEHLHELRKLEHAVFETMGEYEDYLFRTHDVHKPDISEPCYYFVGIVSNTDYITVDPNPLMPDC